MDGINQNPDSSLISNNINIFINFGPPDNDKETISEEIDQIPDEKVTNHSPTSIINYINTDQTSRGPLNTIICSIFFCQKLKMPKTKYCMLNTAENHQ